MSRLAPLVVSLALAVSLTACEEILPPEPEPEVIALVLSGYLGFEPDTVRVSIGDTLEARGKRFSFALTAEMFRDLGRKMIATADMLPAADETTPSVKKTGPVDPSAN